MYRPNVRCLYPRLENVLTTCFLWLDFNYIYTLIRITQKIEHKVGSYHPSIFLPLLYFNTFLGLVGRSPFKCILVNFYINLRHIFVFLRLVWLSNRRYHINNFSNYNIKFLAFNIYILNAIINHFRLRIRVVCVGNFSISFLLCNYGRFRPCLNIYCY